MGNTNEEKISIPEQFVNWGGKTNCILEVKILPTYALQGCSGTYTVCMMGTGSE